jgi:HK97 gp10 family phage protein
MADKPISAEENSKQVADDLRAELQAMRKNLKQQLFRALTLVEAEILQNLRHKSGLRVRTGALLNSIGASKRITEEADGTLTGQIGSQGVPYARIHEFGGTTKPHVIVPRNKKALKFKGAGGDDVFAKIVNHPGSKIPARPYLRPALEAKREQILKDFGLFLSMSFPPKKG